MKAGKATKRRPTSKAAGPSSTAQNDLFAAVVQAFQGDAEIGQSKMFGAMGLMARGKVFAMIYQGSLVVKLPKDRVDDLVASGRGKHFDPGHGRLMKEWVAVKPTSKNEWIGLAREARTFVGSLV